MSRIASAAKATSKTRCQTFSPPPDRSGDGAGSSFGSGSFDTGAAPGGGSFAIQLGFGRARDGPGFGPGLLLLGLAEEQDQRLLELGRLEAERPPAALVGYLALGVDQVE